ncbi:MULTISPECIES: phosphatase PAP2 family protein [unclassified Kribbella]|uniref:phosphatase PAP2 family protein n=1 Tax=unclassified Kribbella TaxID=2644121 RepID=UPI00301ADA12
MILAVIGLYFGIRGLIETRVGLAYRNAERIVELEQSAGIFTEPEMQNAVADHAWLVDAVSYFYIYGHWPVLAVTLLWLMIRHRHEYSRFRNAILISGAVGLLIFALFPVAPPRFLTGYGFVDTVTEQTSAYRVLQPPAFVNQYAAVPSLHFGWNLLMGIAWASLAGHWIARLFGWLMPPAMLASIVLTANHYLLDGLAGGAIALLALLAATHLTARRTRRRKAQTPNSHQPQEWTDGQEKTDLLHAGDRRPTDPRRLCSRAEQCRRHRRAAHRGLLARTVARRDQPDHLHRVAVHRQGERLRRAQQRELVRRRFHARRSDRVLECRQGRRRHAPAPSPELRRHLTSGSPSRTAVIASATEDSSTWPVSAA